MEIISITANFQTALVSPKFLSRSKILNDKLA